jgi:hypothetical protein
MPVEMIATDATGAALVLVVAPRARCGQCGAGDKMVFFVRAESAGYSCADCLAEGGWTISSPDEG